MARRIEELNTSLIIKSSKEQRENRQYAKIDCSKPHKPISFVLHKTSFVIGKSSNSVVLTSKVYSLLLGFDESCLLHLVSNGGWLRAASALQSVSSSKSCLHLLNTLNHRAKQRCTCFPRFLRVSSQFFQHGLPQRSRKDVGDKQKHTLPILNLFPSLANNTLKCLLFHISN